MNWNLVSLDVVTAVPWSNGGGVTRELLAWPDAGGWRVRMSVAEVEADGPFSRFEGVQRWFAVLDGAGVKLRLDGEEYALTRDSSPFEFDGAVATDCALTSGPTGDFNLMLRGGSGEMARVRGLLARRCAALRFIAVYAHLPAQLTSRSDAMALPARTLAWRILDAGCDLRIESRDALWMEIAL